MKGMRQVSRAAKLRRMACICGVFAVLVGIGLSGWVYLGGWPNPVRGKLPWRPDVILVLGGGDSDRPEEAMRLAKIFPKVPVIVTGDGSLIYDKLVSSGMPEERIIHEIRATSTMENARFTREVLDQLQAQRVILVTDWFHVPRATAIFERVYSDREFFLSFPPKPEVLNNWHTYCARRERLAVLHNLVRHGIWSF
jgi:uncharacterized SAM-binding protein YcdF (DUF218 family)